MPRRPRFGGDGAHLPRLVRTLRTLPLAIILFAAVISFVAVADHRRKQQELNSVQVAEWMCEHHGTDCGSEPWELLEARWQRRELSYDVAVIAMSGTAAGLLLGMWRRGKVSV
jgi:hypothetical protein